MFLSMCNILKRKKNLKTKKKKKKPSKSPFERFF